MRIEKINDNQIRCFLSKEEMDRRQIHLKELAYGTEKARKLFRELMREARARHGFEAENTPVMIEAVPLQDDSLVLIVTRVDNPEELDTRFSSFSPSVKSGSADAQIPSNPVLGQLLEAIHQSTESGSAGTVRSKNGEEERADIHQFVFTSLGTAVRAAAAAAGGFTGKSSLYRDPSGSRYYLFVSPGEGEGALSVSGTVAALSEFCGSELITPAREQYLREHSEAVCAENALLILSGLEAEDPLNSSSPDPGR